MLFVRFVEIPRSSKGSDMMFLNNQEGQEGPKSILMTYKTSIHPASLGTNSFSWTVIAVQHLDALSVNNKHNNDLWVLTRVFFFFIYIYFQLYAHINHSHFHINTLNNATKDKSKFLFYFIYIWVLPLLSIWIFFLVNSITFLYQCLSLFQLLQCSLQIIN